MDMELLAVVSMLGPFINTDEGQRQLAAYLDSRALVDITRATKWFVDPHTGNVYTLYPEQPETLHERLKRLKLL